MIAPLDPGGLIEALNSGEVEFIVIGGFAVSAHGLPRATKDLDIVPDPAPDNLQRLVRVLERLEAEIMGSDEFELDELPATDPKGLLELGGNVVLSTNLGRLDIFQLVTPELEYEHLLPASVTDHVFGHQVRFCGYQDLVRMKEAAGRPEDLSDIQRLREIRGEG